MASNPARGHLYEVDLVRVVTALSVVAVHATWFTLGLNTTAWGTNVQVAVVGALHFTRQVFLAITAFVLVYVYARRPFASLPFWRKRGLGVLLPYLLWSLLYVWLQAPHSPIQAWLQAALVATLTGTASYQLYFILLSLEFYLVLPAFLPFIERIGERYPWRLLLGSGLLQVAFSYVDYHYIQVGPFSGTPLGQFINAYQYSFLPFYQFYVVLGGVAALHADRLRAYVRDRGHLILAATAGGLALLWLRTAVALGVEHASAFYAIDVFQPVMVPYAVATTLFLYWLGVVWATSRPAEVLPGRRFMSLLADASFGIYLIHPVFLGLVLERVLPRLPVALPVAVRVVAVWALAAGLTAATTIVLLHTPLLSRLVGRPSRLAPPKAGSPSPAGGVSRPNGREQAPGADAPRTRPSGLRPPATPAATAGTVQSRATRPESAADRDSRLPS